MKFFSFLFGPRLWTMLRPSPNPNNQTCLIKQQWKPRTQGTARKKEAYQKFPCWRSCRADTSGKSRPWLLSKSFTSSRQRSAGLKSAVQGTRAKKANSSTPSDELALPPARHPRLLCAEVSGGTFNLLGRKTREIIYFQICSNLGQ